MKTRVRFSYDQYEEMIRLGLFNPSEKHRVELIFGRIVPVYGKSRMSPINPPHDNSVDELIEWTTEVLPPRSVRIRAQGSIGLGQFQSLPQPDFAWLIHRQYPTERPKSEDVLLLVEVSDSTLTKDRGKKAKLYAKAGIRDYWIVNVQGRCIEVHRNPLDGKYQDVTVFQTGQEVHPLAFPEVSLPVSRIFPD